MNGNLLEVLIVFYVVASLVLWLRYFSKRKKTGFLHGLLVWVLSFWPLVIFDELTRPTEWTVKIAFILTGLLVLWLIAVMYRKHWEPIYGKEFWKKPPFSSRLFYGAITKQGKALHGYDLHLEKNPGDWEAWQKKGEIFEQLGETEEAHKCYKKALVIQG